LSPTACSALPKPVIDFNMQYFFMKEVQLF
jgi:hypothetical protein